MVTLSTLSSFANQPTTQRKNLPRQHHPRPRRLRIATPLFTRQVIDTVHGYPALADIGAHRGRAEAPDAPGRIDAAVVPGRCGQWACRVAAGVAADAAVDDGAGVVGLVLDFEIPSRAWRWRCYDGNGVDPACEQPLDEACCQWRAKSHGARPT